MNAPNLKKEKKIFKNIKKELDLITATVKFNFITRKTSEQDLEITPTYVEATAKLDDLLKSRLNLLTEATR